MNLESLLKKSTVTVGGVEYEARELPIAAYAEMNESPKLSAAIVWKWSLGLEESAEEIAKLVPPRLLAELQNELVSKGLAPADEDDSKNSESVQTGSSSSG